MKSKKITSSILRAGLVLLNSISVLHAQEPTFDIIPTTPTAFFLPVNSSEVVQYKVTNKTNITRKLAMKAITGASQTSEGCTNPFTLAPNDSCLLTLQLNGNQMPARINGGPIVCQTGTDNTPNPNLCAQPSLVNSLSVTAIAAIPTQQAYVTNWAGHSVSLCDVSTMDGSLSNCAITATSPFANPEAVALNPDKTLLYVANINPSATVTFCQIESDGTLSNCAATGGPFNGADGVSINATNTLAYVSNAFNHTVSVCAIDSITGALSTSCISTGNGLHTPSDMTINDLNTKAYVSNLTGSVSACDIDGTTGLLNCNDKTLGFDQPEGITLHTNGQFAYITNNGNNTVSVCRVNPLTGHLKSCAVTNGNFNGFGNLAFNATGTRAYIPNLTLNTVFVCSVNQNTGALSRCRDSHGSGFVGPSGILLK